jgi:fructokinase
MKITVFGDILWDIFPDKREIGGAAFNFAAHMAQLGADVKMLSALGLDKEGDDAYAEAQKYGVDLSGVARIADVPTGRSLITLTDGIPDYDLPFPVAYDCIPLPKNEDGGAAEGDALYFGTLPVRQPDYPSRASLLELFEHGRFREFFFDINIRKTNYTQDLVELALGKATIMKLSRDEQDAVRIDADNGDHLAFCRALTRKYPNMKLVLLTLDKDGAAVYSAEEDKLYYSPVPHVKLVSTVGGGDSLSACFLYNYLNGVDVEECLLRASKLANYVVEHLGAIPPYTPELLKEIR